MDKNSIKARTHNKSMQKPGGRKPCWVHVKLSQGLPTFGEFISTYKSLYEGWQPFNTLRQF
jgi:hypothetical protein